MAENLLQGRGCLEQVGALLKQLGVNRPMLVGGDRLSKIFVSRTEINLPCFSGYHPNPDFDDCNDGAGMFRANGCDGLVSIGGGSAMDTAKGIKALLLADSANDALACCFSEEKIPHVAIPATAGTGAEATQFTVVYLEGMKHSLSHPVLLPDGVVLDSTLLETLPDYQKKSCAMDALCQGIESWWAVGATVESRVHAGAAIQGVMGRVRAYMAGDASAAQDMLLAAFRSGQAIQISRTTAAHAMSYRLTHHFGMAHGHACAVTLPVLWELLLEDPDQQNIMQGLASVMGLDDPCQGPDVFRGLMLELGLEIPPLPDEDVLKDLTASVNAERLGNHPQKLSQIALNDVYVKAMTPLSAEKVQQCLAMWRKYGGS